MAKVYDIGLDTYAQWMSYPSKRFPIYDKGITREIDPPFRLGISRVVRLPFSRRAFVFGKWVAVLPEIDALVDAISARSLDETQDLKQSDSDV